MSVEKTTGDRAPLVVVGYDFRVAGASWRSRLVSKPEDDDALAARLSDSGMADGLIALNTCNRNELIASAENPEWCGEILRAQFVRKLREGGATGPIPVPYVFAGRQAVEHVLRTAAGLESFVVGERQIASQLNCALRVGASRRRADVILNGLSSFCGRAAREALRLNVGESGLRGVHDLALRLLETRLRERPDATVVILGLGDIGRRTLDSLRARTTFRPILVNRTPRPSFRERVLPLEALPEALAQAEAVIVATGAPEPVLTPESIAPRSAAHPLLVVDIGIPVQSAASVGELAYVELLDLDGLQAASGGLGREGENYAALSAALDELTGEFLRFCREREVVHVLHTTQSKHEEMVNALIPQVLDEELPDCPAQTRERVAFRLRGLVRDYTNAVIASVHQSKESRS